MPAVKSLNIHQRIAAVMADIKYVQKDKGQGIPYSFVSHDKVTGIVRPALLAHGVIATQTVVDHELNGNNTVVTTLVSFINIDKPEDKIEIQSFGYGVDKQDKGPGKAMSYAFKYALLKCFCLETGDDPERDQIDREDTPPSEGLKPVKAGTAVNYTGTKTQKKALKKQFDLQGITDTALMKDVSDMLIGKPMSELPALMKDAKTEQG